MTAAGKEHPGVGSTRAGTNLDADSKGRRLGAGNSGGCQVQKQVRLLSGTVEASDSRATQAASVQRRYSMAISSRLHMVSTLPVGTRQHARSKYGSQKLHRHTHAPARRQRRHAKPRALPAAAAAAAGDALLAAEQRCRRVAMSSADTCMMKSDSLRKRPC